MKIQLVQSDVTIDIEKNIESFISLVQLNADVIVFPELFSTGFYNLKNLSERSHTINSSVIKRFQALAKQNNSYIILGSIAINNGSNVFTNTTLVINRLGEIISRYDKNNLFPLMKEPRYFSSGTKTHHFEIDGRKCSSIICYDLRFPELISKILAESEFDVLFIPAQWPTPREGIFKKLVQARAIENQCYVVFVNRVGSDKSENKNENKSERFLGLSIVANPYGEVVFEAGAEAGSYTVEIDLNIITKARELIPVLKVRKAQLNQS